jgi:alanine dehydrogenase
VTVISRGLEGLRRVEERWPGRVTTLPSTPFTIERSLEGADVLVGGVLIAGAHAPSLVSRAQVRSMGPGAVIVDVDIDQGGCVETARATTHDDPVYVEEEVVHYGVANMPGSVPFSSTRALATATLPYVQRLAELGIGGVDQNSALLAGVNVKRGRITNAAVAEALGEEMVSAGDLS